MAPDSLLPITLVISSVTRVGLGAQVRPPFPCSLFSPGRPQKWNLFLKTSHRYLLLQSYILLLSLCWGCETGSHVPQPGFELAGQTGLEDLVFLLATSTSQVQSLQTYSAKPSLFSNPLTYLADDNKSSSLFRWGSCLLSKEAILRNSQTLLGDPHPTPKSTALDETIFDHAA